MWVEEDTYILDTPGFSSIELFGIEKEELGAYFRKSQHMPEIAGFGDARIWRSRTVR